MPTDKLPHVTVIIAAYNEEKVIAEKIASINANQYPVEKLSILIGSDQSTDATNAIVNKLAPSSKYPLSLHIMPKRSGKIGVLNYFYEKIIQHIPDKSAHILLLTDANVMLQKDTIFQLVKHFKNKSIGIVDAHMQSKGHSTVGIASSENKYINREFKLKHQEGKVFQALMGSFGGCYAIRATYFVAIPAHYKVDDFFLTMKTLSGGGGAINEPLALCHEEATHHIYEEYRRKRRISSGNFQNIAHFRRYILPISTLSFVFFSHKFIRYIGPLLMGAILFASLYLAYGGYTFAVALVIAQGLWYVGIPILDKILQKLGLNLLVLRNVRYFNYMNLALLLGLKDYMMGIDSNIWEPTKRN